MASERQTTKTGGRGATTGVIEGAFALSVGMPAIEPPKDWRWVKLSDIARLESGHTPSRKHPEYWGGSICWLGIRDATANHGRTIYNTNQHTNDLGIANSSARILPRNTVCLSRTASVGYVIVMGREMSTSQDFVNWICDPEYLDYRFLMYVLLAENKSYSRFSHGTTHQTIYFPEVKAFHVCLPSLREQYLISNILESLDNKIELNRQTNKTLEKMAQALFKSWFVDFDPVIDNALEAGNTIPDELQDRAERRKQQLAKPDHQPLPDDIRQIFPTEFELNEELGWVPMGWVVKKADEVSDVAIGKTPPRKQKEWFSSSKKSNVVWVSIRDMGGVSAHISNSSEYLTHEAIDKFNVKVVPKDSVLLSFKLTLGRVSIANCDLTTNEAIAHFSNPKHELSKEYIYCYLKCFSYEKLGSTSSIATAVNSKIIKAMPLLVPNEKILHAFQGKSKYWFSRMELISRESSALGTLRDTLLPKLISGELRLPADTFPDADQQLADATS